MPSIAQRFARIPRAAGWVGVALVVAFGSCGRVPFSEHAEDDAELRTLAQGIVCGVERWAVKTGTDVDVGGVNMNPQETTLATLVSFPRPGSLPPARRISGPEFQVYRLTDITMTVYKLETDSDYHLVLWDGFQTMIAEIPHPDCVGPGSPFLPGIRDARASFDRSYRATTTFQTANVPATVVGAGFFDFLHGQRGVAPNGIELHSVLSICFGLGCGGPVPDDFSISITPPTQTAPQGGSAVYTIETAVTSGNPQMVNLDATNLPLGVTPVFNPPSVTAGAASQLTLWVSPTTPVGISTFSVTGAGPSATHSTSADLNVVPATADNPIVNGDFETGDFTGWVWETGFARVTLTTPHSGLWAAQVGSRFPLVGDSTISQVFNVPAIGTNTLSFWFKPHCNDIITYDWLDAEIRSVAGDLLLGMLHVCDASGIWQQVSADLTPYNGTSVKLVFTAHDDGSPGDPTWFHIDDVVLTTQ